MEGITVTPILSFGTWHDCHLIGSTDYYNTSDLNTSSPTSGDHLLLPLPNIMPEAPSSVAITTEQFQVPCGSNTSLLNDSFHVPHLGDVGSTGILTCLAASVEGSKTKENNYMHAFQCCVITTPITSMSSNR